MGKPITGKCASIERRANADFSALVRAWDKLKLAQGRLNNLKRYGAHNPKAHAKARAAVDSADSAVRSASTRVDRTFAANNKCLRRIGTLSGSRR